MSATPIPKGIRFQVLRRDNFACRYCGRPAPEVVLEVDHVTPRAAGGTNDPSNLVTACADCNRGKAATPPGPVIVADVAQRELQWVARRRDRKQAEQERQRYLGFLKWDFRHAWIKSDEWDESACPWPSHELVDGDNPGDPPRFKYAHIGTCECTPAAPPLPPAWPRDIMPLLEAGATGYDFREMWDRYNPEYHGPDREAWVLKWAAIEAEQRAERVAAAKEAASA